EREQLVIQAQVFTDVSAHRRICRQYQQTIAFLGDAQLLGRAQHAKALDVADLGFLDVEVARQLRTNQRARHLEADSGIRRAADDLQHLTADIDGGQAQLVRVGVLFGGENLANYHLAERRRSRIQLLQLEAGHG